MTGSHYDPRFAEELRIASQTITKIMTALGARVIGQERLRSRLILALLTDGHILLEGVPGLAKTLSIKALAQTVQATFKRIQFTPDLLPADLIGSEVFRPQDGKFEVRKGPVFANFVLADEINRAPAKVQSALLETMQERQVTIGEGTFKVPDPFLVLATQNPIEQEGTYPLPEAQIDRFIMKVRVDYPAPQEEKLILDLFAHGNINASEDAPVASLDDIQRIKNLVPHVYVDDRVKQYMVNLVAASRNPSQYNVKVERLIELGASPRGSISLFLAARAEALLNGANYVTPQNVKDVALDVLRHRIIPTYEAEAQGVAADEIVKTILDNVQVP